MRSDEFVSRRMLGNGAHGLVMCWRRKSDQKDFAAKLFFPNRASSFEREKSVYNTIAQHPNLVPMVAAVDEGPKRVLLFPYHLERPHLIQKVDDSCILNSNTTRYYDGGDMFGALKWMEQHRPQEIHWMVSIPAVKLM